MKKLGKKSVRTIKSVEAFADGNKVCTNWANNDYEKYHCDRYGHYNYIYSADGWEAAHRDANA